MDPSDWLERQEDELYKEYEAGHMTRAEFDKAMRELHSEYRDMANDAAAEAAERERERW